MWFKSTRGTGGTRIRWEAEVARQENERRRWHVVRMRGRGGTTMQQSNRIHNRQGEGREEGNSNDNVLSSHHLVEGNFSSLQPPPRSTSVVRRKLCQQKAIMQATATLSSVGADWCCGWNRSLEVTSCELRWRPCACFCVLLIAN